MKILITAGNTVVPIDKVRCITNIFTGRTGASIAVTAQRRGHEVVLLTSHPDAATDLFGGTPPSDGWRMFTFSTFEDLQQLMADHVRGGGLDAVIHCAAVSDYQAAGVYAPAAGTRFDSSTARWSATGKNPPRLEDRAAGKVKSDADELWLRLVKTPKLVDYIRSDWGFGGVLVKFKLEVDTPDANLLEIAERSREQSAADLMVANTLEGAGTYAFIGAGKDYQRVSRRQLAERLLEAVEALHKERGHG